MLKHLGKRLTHTICKRTTSDSEQVKQIKRGAFGDQVRSYKSLHAWCASATAQKDPLALLKACKQINAEASLLAYSVCQFSLYDQEAFGRFLNTIMPQQAAMIQEVSIVLDLRDLDGLCRLEEMIHNKLTGVKRVVMLLESNDSDADNASGVTMRYRKYFGDRGSAMFPSSVSSVAIAMYSIAGTHPSETLNPDRARSWELKMEELIVGVQ